MTVNNLKQERNFLIWVIICSICTTSTVSLYFAELLARGFIGKYDLLGLVVGSTTGLVGIFMLVLGILGLTDDKKPKRPPESGI